ncbi:homoserine kinase [Kineosporia sp. NBRC 101731]|uniref:homoserine kinase n=1 Tax=Kineosporia sp. NBRC 101731 TaxID=3032199 RepID=UPI0024A2BE5E|nr:homoserine kinase [Kineosporia sp. NBRC 101731]GLY27999.1 homoserine kinase [Kineosporia sp. NBRC 101731]
MSLDSAPVAGRGLLAHRRATVRVPATSANLGPGFDSMGLALALHDVVTLSPAASGLEVTVEGEGAGGVPLTEDHLVVRAVRAGFDHAGVPQPGIRLHCANSIPHGRGLGSSAAAVVAGLVAARGCLAEPEALDDATVLALATSLEGHPDNAAAALLGGCTISWLSPSGVPRAERVEVRADLDPVVCVPSGELSTNTARAMLPALVPHPDASFNAGRAALLVHALTRRPDLLLEATEDRLHQAQRAPAMPETAELVHRVRELGAAAVVSGAGPSVLVLGVRGEAIDAVNSALGGPTAHRWTVLRPGIDTVGSILATEGE